MSHSDKETQSKTESQRGDIDAAPFRCASVIQL